jgi:serine/threonine-protein kinase
MAPEQARGGADVDHRADLYALGVVAYEALAGVHPFRARAPGALIAAHLGETPAPLGAIRPDVPPALAALVRQLLAKDPAARPRNAEEVLRSLDTVPASLSDAPEQIAREPELPVRMRNAKRIRWRTLAVALLLVLLALVGYSLRSRTAAARSGTGPEPGPAEIQTLAVLPFENLGGSAADEYFSDGMADELAHALSRLPDLKIAGRTSSYAFTKMEVPTQQIGRTLGVAALVTGTVRRSGERLRVTTQLVSTADGTLLWDSIFESHTGDVFAVQDELTRAIVTALAPALRADAVASKGRGTTDPEAYELYLKGHYHFLLRGAENLERAIGYFERAIARDPGFARAHAGLALVYNVVPIYVPVASDSIVARMESSARRALVLDSTLADAHLAMASVLELQLRFREALPHYRAAVALDPASATAHHWYGMNLLMQGQHDDALAELHRATQLDPLAPSAAGGVSLAYLFARRLPEALDAGRHALSLHSTNPVVILAMGRVQVFAGEPDSAARTLERGLQLYPRDARLMAELVFAYAAAGRWDEAARIRARLHRRDVALLDGTEPAFADLVFGDLEPLVRVLSSAEGARRYVMGGGILGCDPLLDPLWADARFRAAMRRIGIEPCTLARRWSLPPPQRTEGR